MSTCKIITKFGCRSTDKNWFYAKTESKVTLESHDISMKNCEIHSPQIFT